MIRRAPQDGQRELEFSYPEPPAHVPTRVQRLENKNKDALRQFLARVITGNSYGLSKEECARCVELAERNLETMSPEALAAAVTGLGIRTRERPGLPEWAKIALLQYRKLHEILSGN